MCIGFLSEFSPEYFKVCDPGMYRVGSAAFERVSAR